MHISFRTPKTRNSEAFRSVRNTRLFSSTLLRFKLSESAELQQAIEENLGRLGYGG